MAGATMPGLPGVVAKTAYLGSFQELTVDTSGRTLDDCARQVVQYILERQ